MLPPMAVCSFGYRQKCAIIQYCKRKKAGQCIMLDKTDLIRVE
jgi:hypothetical protein